MYQNTLVLKGVSHLGFPAKKKNRLAKKKKLFVKIFAFFAFCFLALNAKKLEVGISVHSKIRNHMYVYLRGLSSYSII